VYYGGLPAAVDLVRSGLAKPDDFKLLLGMTGGETRHGYFLSAARRERVNAKVVVLCEAAAGHDR
jgi:hypothetical protein